MRINKAKSCFYEETNGNDAPRNARRDRRKAQINNIRNGKGADLQRLQGLKDKQEYILNSLISINLKTDSICLFLKNLTYQTGSERNGDSPSPIITN